MSSLTRRSPVGFVQTRECRQGPIGRASMATAFVQGQINLLCGAVLSFGLAHYSMSKFELLAEELLMSDSVIRDENVETSSLEASNLIVLNGLSHIHSNANLVVHGQDLFYLSRLDDCMEAQCLVFSFFYVIKVGPGSVLCGPLIISSDDVVIQKLYCDSEDCPAELLHPPKRL